MCAVSVSTETTPVRKCLVPQFEIVHGWKSVYAAVQNKLHCPLLEIVEIALPSRILLLHMQKLERLSLLLQSLQVHMLFVHGVL